MNFSGMDPITYEDEAFPILLKACEGHPATNNCWHEDLEIKMVDSGDFSVILDTGIVTAQADELVFVNPYQIHSMPVLEKKDRLYYCMIVNLDFFQKAGIPALDLRRVFLHNRLRVHNLIRRPYPAELFKRIFDARDAGGAYARTRILGLLTVFFSVLLDEEVSDRIAGETEVDRQRYCTVQPAVEMIHTLYGRRLTLEELAGECRISVYHFCHLFKQVMGMTPGQYQMEYRMQVADLLLKKEDLPISAVAHELGFRDEAYFSRCYKKHRGNAPRKNAKQ